MATNPLVQYRQEYLLDFARRKAPLVQAVRTDSQDRGGSTVFLVVGDGGRTMTTRGNNGLIVPADNSQTPVTLDYVEEHDRQEMTAFDIFAAHGDQLRIMRETSIGVVHRAQDKRIIAALETGTVTLGAVGTMNQSVANKIVVTLGNANVGSNDNGNLYAAISVAAYSELMNIVGFSSVDYTMSKKLDGGIPEFGVWTHWMGINWMPHQGITGHGTSAATCLAWHKNSVGYGMSTRGINVETDRDGKEDTSWTRATIFHGAVKLINAGIVKFTHDDTAALAA